MNEIRGVGKGVRLEIARMYLGHIKPQRKARTDRRLSRGLILTGRGHHRGRFSEGVIHYIRITIKSLCNDFA